MTPCNKVQLTGVSEKSVKFLQDYKGTGASSPCALGVRRTPNTNSCPLWVINARFYSAGEMLPTISFSNASSLLRSSSSEAAVKLSFLSTLHRPYLGADVAVRSGKNGVLSLISVQRLSYNIRDGVAARKLYRVDIFTLFLSLFFIILTVR